MTTDIYSQVSSRRRRRECDVVGPSRSDPRDPEPIPSSAPEMISAFGSRSGTGQLKRWKLASCISKATNVPAAALRRPRSSFRGAGRVENLFCELHQRGVQRTRVLANVGVGAGLKVARSEMGRVHLTAGTVVPSKVQLNPRGANERLRIGTWNLAGRWSDERATLIAEQRCDVWLLTEVRNYVDFDGYHRHFSEGVIVGRRHWAAVFSRKALK